MDSGNLGVNSMITLGNFQGGGLYIYSDGIKDMRFSMHEVVPIIPHMTMLFQGDRYSLIYYMPTLGSIWRQKQVS